MGIYCPPSAPHMALEETGNLMSSFASSELTVLGDLNLDWLSESSARLKELCLELLIFPQDQIQRIHLIPH